MEDSRPYLTLVLTGRNDNYGGDFRSRLQRCLSNAYVRLMEAGIEAEIIFVNYNPVPENEPIESFIEWPVSNAKLTVRIITVPGEIHKSLIKSGMRKDVPVLEYLGKNAGIRRAKGEFILSMNPDIILTKKLVRELKSLQKKRYYRADRIDFQGDISANHQFSRVFLKGHDFPITALKELRGLRFKNYLDNAWKCFTPQISGLLNRFSKTVYYNQTTHCFHCNVSGDFMLMHRDYWIELEAHNEMTFISLHVDSLIVVQAAQLGLAERVLKSPIYHQEHERRYDATEKNPIFETAFRFFEEQSVRMIEQQKPKKYNGEHWGLAKFELPEIKL